MKNNTVRVHQHGGKKNQSPQVQTPDGKLAEIHVAGLINPELIKLHAASSADMRLKVAEGLERGVLKLRVGFNRVDGVKVSPKKRDKAIRDLLGFISQLRTSVRLMDHAGIASAEQFDDVNMVLCQRLLQGDAHRFLNAAERVRMARTYRRWALQLESSAIPLQAIEQLNLPGHNVRN